jgi:alkyl sulfatase BDS1-like metallo-beta-lactamase superfamily hydrolase
LTVIKLLVFPLFLILFSSSFIYFSFASVESEAQEDIEAGCLDVEALVYRFAYSDYVCVPQFTADKWVKYEMAKIIIESKQVEKEKSPQQLNPEFYGAPPLQQEKIRVSIYDSECRAGYVQFHHIHYLTTSCIAFSTAGLWEELGLGIIIKSEIEVPEENEDYELEQDIIEEEALIEKQTIPISTEGILLPSYPNQPSIRPELEATNEFWSPPAIHQVNDRIWVAVGYDLANSIMIEGDKGIIIVDTLSTYEKAKEVMQEFRKITDKPVKAIIYTHGHLDHVQGTKAFLEEGDGDVEIIAHESLLDFYINENSVLGPIASVRTVYATGVMLPEEDRNMGLFPNPEPGTIAFVAPTHTFSSEFLLDISGVKMNLVYVAGESSDQLYVWLPDDDTLLIGDNIYSIFPNIYTLRGAVYRDPMNYVNALDQMIPLEPKYMVPSHVKPVSGKDKVMDILISTRDATQYVYDQTIRGMNNGYTADELSHMIELPSWFEDNPWLTESRGQIPWHVKQIYYGNLGWYQGDPTFLLPISEEQRAHKFVEGFGGVDIVIQQVRQAIDDTEYSWAAELATYVIVVDPNNDEAKLLKAHALRVIGQQMLSADARHWALTSALELEGKIIIDPNAFSQTSPEQLAELPIDKILKSLSTKLDPAKVGNDQFILNIIYSDTHQEFTLHFRNGILAVVSGLSSFEDHTITLDTDTHKLLISGKLKLFDVVDSGQIQSDGDLIEFKKWMSYLHPFDIDFNPDEPGHFK